MEQPPLDVWREIAKLINPRDHVALAAADVHLNAFAAPTVRSLALARHLLRVRLRAVRAALAHRAEFARRDTGREPLLPARDAGGSIAARLGRAPHGPHDLLAAAQKALAAVEEQSLVLPRCLARVRQDLTHVATLACLVAWRQTSRERARQQREDAAAAAAAAPAPAPPGAQPGAQAQQQNPQPRPGEALVARGVQTVGPSLGDVRELVAAFRALAESSNPSSRLCRCSLNLLDHYLSREAWGAAGEPAGGGGTAAVAG